MEYFRGRKSPDERNVVSQGEPPRVPVLVDDDLGRLPPGGEREAEVVAAVVVAVLPAVAQVVLAENQLPGKCERFDCFKQRHQHQQQ